ncbi:MAG: hypothetical protein K2P73_03195 [Lachnospiraceae bacterium]|nr:hypothetical protein [Lachnospiraceae bacterium]
MKLKFIAVALLITTLLSGCGNTQTTEIISSAENQVTETPIPENKEIPVPDNWWKNKLYQEQTAGTGMYFWIEEIENRLYLVVSGIPNGDLSMELCIGIMPNTMDNYTTYDDNHVQFQVESDTNTILLYNPNDDQCVIYTDSKYGGSPIVSGVYDQVLQHEAEKEMGQNTEQPDVTQEEQPQSTQEPELRDKSPIEQQPDDFYTDGDYTTYGRYQCFETDTFVSVETQNGSLILYFEPEAETFVLDRNGADTGWEFINWEFENRVYTSAAIQDNEMTISSTEPWKYDGTYIQLPDMGTDGEVE